MYRGARIAAIGDAAGIPERPSCESGGAWDACGRGLEEVELVCRVLIHSAPNED